LCVAAVAVACLALEFLVCFSRVSCVVSSQVPYTYFLFSAHLILKRILLMMGVADLLNALPALTQNQHTLSVSL